MTEEEGEPASKRIKLDPSAEQPAAENGRVMEDNSGPHEATIDATILKNGPNSDKDSDNAVGAPPKEPPLPAAPAAPSAAVPVVEPMAPVDTYCSREARHRDREASGELQALYVQNDGAPMSGKLLIGLKNVFAKCLPNMPKTYITRLLFDRRHRSVVIVRNGGKVIGGITYRPFHERRFAEIAFCAVAQTLQVSGFGTRLMNWTKHYARERDGCEFFLTYADNNAVGYFSKQGFTKVLTMPRERWHGFIKDYDGGTLMEGFIHPTLPFTDLPGMIAEQRAALDSAVRQYTTAHVVHSGLTRWKEAEAAARAQQAERAEAERSEEEKTEGAPAAFRPAIGFVPRPPPLPLGDIPGVKEAGWSEALYAIGSPKCEVAVGGRLLPPTPENLAALQRQLLVQLEAEKDMVWPFLEPVDPKHVPDYYDCVKDPIDLGTIRKRVDEGHMYVTMDIFAADVQRVFMNAKFYNAADTGYYKFAYKLSGMFQTWLNAAVHYEMPTPQ